MQLLIYMPLSWVRHVSEEMHCKSPAYLVLDLSAEVEAAEEDKSSPGRGRNQRSFKRIKIPREIL